MNIVEIDDVRKIPKTRIVGFDIESSPDKSLGLTSAEYERHGTDPRISKVVLAQVALEDGTVYVFQRNFETLRTILEDSKVIKIIHTATFEYKYMFWHYSIEIKNLVDIATYERIIEAGRQALGSLEVLSMKYLDRQLDKTVRKRFIDGHKITREMIEYAATDADVLIPIYRRQQKEAYVGSGKVAKLEFKLVPVISKIELRGVRIDRRKWMQVYADNMGKLKRVKDELMDYSPSNVRRTTMFGSIESSVNLNSRDIKIKMLEAEGIELPDLRYSTLDEYYHRTNSPLIRLLLEYSKLAKVTSTYGKGFLDNINPKTKRVHQQIRQVEARTGRLAGRYPNLMNIPKTSSHRACFIPKEGYVFAVGDYSGQEMVILAEISQEEALIDAFINGIDVHVSNARLLFDDPHVTKQDPRRKKAKNMSFGLVYGMGLEKLAKSMQVTLKEAKRLMGLFAERLPKAFKYMVDIVFKARQEGFVETLLGRRRYLDVSVPDYERQAKNTPIQGSAADMIKLALLIISYRLPENCYLVNVVHDEIIVECPKDEAEQVLLMMTTAMAEAGKMLVKTVPVNVSGYIGYRWEEPEEKE